METKDRRPTRPATGRTGNQSRPGSTAQRKRTTSSPKTSTRTRPAERPVRKPSDSEIVYTQPRPFNRRQLLLQLATVAAVVLALLFGMSIFFKVDESKIMVSGVNKYTEVQIREASGIRDGENLLLLSDAKISASIIAQLPYVKSVRVGIKLPDTVQIEIVELDVVYSIEADDGSWWLISASGDVIEKTNAVEAAKHTKVVGVKLAQPVAGQKAQAFQEQNQETTPEGETAPVTVLASERLSAVISILEYLEDNGVIGKAASLNVSDMGAIEFWYGQQYRVILGDTTQLSYKVKTSVQAIRQLLAKPGTNTTGVLDATYTTWPDEIHFSPLS